VRLLLLLLSIVCFLGCSEHKPTPYEWPLIEGFPKPQVPSDNPMTEEKVALGKKIFFDTQLSFNQQQSCASCHLPERAFSERLAQSVGSTGELHRRNSLALVNVAYNKTLTWGHDGIVSLEQQILLPMFGEEPIELGITGNEDVVLARFQSAAYQKLFEDAFGDNTASFERIVKALASYVRSLISVNSAFDQYAYHGNDSALGEAELRGMELFFSERLECHHCHGGFNFTQSTSHEKQLLDRRPFHNTGLYFVDGGYPAKDIGLAEVSLNKDDDGRFRAPTLRNIAVTAPYMHDGSVSTLEEVIDIYSAGGRNIESGQFKGDGRLHPRKSPFMKGFILTAQEKSDLLAFLHTLTDKQFIDPNNHK